jgi:CelD/BcsL family acetyltransferase involved in cellulose biosynthesis
LTVRVHASLQPAAADWRAVEAIAVLTPYQRYDWIAALLASGLETATRLAIVVLYDHGTPAGILPLKLEKRLGCKTARLIGSEHGNSDWLAATPAVLQALTPSRLTALLAEIARAAGGIDLYGFFNQPAEWLGNTNPLLALSRLPAPNNLYAGPILPTSLPYIDHMVPARHRGNIRRSARRLEETFGKLELRRANTVAELERQHATFLGQRAGRFAQMGIRNIFGDAAFVRFFRLLGEQSFGEARPALVFHALYAGDTIVATSCGTEVGNHYSHYINSIASGEAARFSLISVLLARLYDELVTHGITSIDMGTGDFTYKTAWTAPLPLFHSLIATTPRGRLVRRLVAIGSGSKRVIKQNPTLWQWAQTARRLLYRARHGR